jgi:predicted negative regulator of RcsB-dependent stress response
MATQLDLQEQEQLDQLKAFWNQYGNLITWVLILVLGAYAGWNGWQWYQRDQGVKAGALYDALERSAQAREVDKTASRFADLRDKYGRTPQAAQGALLTARVQADAGQADAARATLGWAADNAADDALRAVARLRLAGLLLEAKQYDEALKQLDAATVPGLAPLVADRRGDVLAAKGQPDAARTAWEQAYRGLAERLEYRRLVEAKLTAIGAAPAASGAGQ